MKKLIPILIVLTVSLLRFFPHPPNFSPISAIILFSAVYLPFKYSLILPFSIMIISDYFLGFHSTMPYVYGSFALIAVLGLFLKNKVSPFNTLKTSLFSSVLFYIITNFGVWISANWYPHTITGLVSCYIAAIPFFRNTLASDLIFTSVIFGCYSLLRAPLNKNNLTAYLNKSKYSHFSKKLPTFRHV